jgi:hypothetical protein
MLLRLVLATSTDRNKTQSHIGGVDPFLLVGKDGAMVRMAL